MDHSTTSFVAGDAAFPDLIFCAKSEDGRSTGQGVVCGFFCLDGDEWLQYEESVNWPVASLVAIKPPDIGRLVVAVGPHGDYWESLAQQQLERVGKIDTDGAFLARRLRAIDGQIFAVGMARKMFLREHDGRWTSVGPYAPLPEGRAAGFNDLAGLSAKDFYAVGWHGEIWRRIDGKKWRQIDSPLSAHLSAACCKPDGTVIAVGYEGAMVEGKGDEWRVVDTGRKENLLGVAHFRGETYACSPYMLMRLTSNGLLPVENLADPDDEPATCLHLLPSNDGGALVSLGPKDLFLLTDAWKRLV